MRVQGLALFVTTDSGTTQATAVDSELADINPVGIFPFAVLVRNTANNAGAHATFAARGSTIVARGVPSANQALGGLALAGPSVPGSSSDATIQNSVVQAVRTDGSLEHFDVGAGNSATAALDHSSYSDVASSAGGTVTPAGSAGGVTGDPGFASPAGGDFSLAPGSPLIDRADPALAAPNELDVTGAPALGRRRWRLRRGSGHRGLRAARRACDVWWWWRRRRFRRRGRRGGEPGRGAGAQAAVPVADLIPADVAGFGLERRRFAVGRGSTAVTAAAKKRRSAPRGTAVRYTDQRARHGSHRHRPGGRRAAVPETVRQADEEAPPPARAALHALHTRRDPRARGGAGRQPASLHGPHRAPGAEAGELPGDDHDDRRRRERVEAEHGVLSGGEGVGARALKAGGLGGPAARRRRRSAPAVWCLRARELRRSGGGSGAGSAALVGVFDLRWNITPKVEHPVRRGAVSARAPSFVAAVPAFDAPLRPGAGRSNAGCSTFGRYVSPKVEHPRPGPPPSSLPFTRPSAPMRPELTDGPTRA